MSRCSRYKQDNEQVCTGGSAKGDPYGVGSRADYPSHWARVVSIAEKIGCSLPTLHEWVKKIQVDSSKRAGVPTEMVDRLKAMEREDRELRQANERLRKAQAYFAEAERA